MDLYSAFIIDNILLILDMDPDPYLMYLDPQEHNTVKNRVAGAALFG